MHPPVIFNPVPAWPSWSAIKVLTGGVITANGYTFTGGNNAVYIVGGATFTLTYNNFDANTNCLRIADTQNPLNHTVTNNTFQNSVKGVYFTGTNVTLGDNYYTQTGTPTMTGIYVTGGQQLYINTGTMINMYRGLEITPSTAQCVEMDHVTFSGLTGVFADQAKYSLYIHDP